MSNGVRASMVGLLSRKRGPGAATETASGPSHPRPSTRKRRWADRIGMSTVIDHHAKGSHFIAARSPRHLIRLDDPPATGIMPKVRPGVSGHPVIRECRL